MPGLMFLLEASLIVSDGEGAIQTACVCGCVYLKMYVRFLTAVFTFVFYSDTIL